MGHYKTLYHSLLVWSHYQLHTQHEQKLKIIKIIDTSHHLQLARINDVFIMQHFIDLDIAPNDLLLLNEMRMSIWALTLADIVTLDGK